ncbi:MAG: FtsX-like permease family protein, partial [Pseudomonadales bacterium]|nr:FtsX-like permease family protein [Pseudomonadales bacterium]
RRGETAEYSGAWRFDRDPQPGVPDLATTVDRDIPLENVRSLEEEMSLYMGDIPVTGTIFQAFALATLVVASIGIYGVIARSIFVRTHEIGVRRALGSSNFKIIRRFIRQGFNYLLIGTLVGAVPAILLLLFTNSTIGYQGSNYIPTIFALVVTALATIICVACYLPARKAVAMEPGDALRYE